MSRHGDLKIAIDSPRYMAGYATMIEGTTIAPSFAYVPHLTFTSYTESKSVTVRLG